MPIQAFGESKYFGSGDASRMADHEQAAPSLRHSEVLAVQSSPGDAIPELNKGVDDGEEVPSSVAGKEPRYILSDNPGGAALSNDPVHLPPERTTVPSQAAAFPCDRVVLAWESSADEVNRLNCSPGSGSMSIPSNTTICLSLIGLAAKNALLSTLIVGSAKSPPVLKHTDIMHVLVVGHVGPMPTEHVPALAVYLHAPCWRHPGPL